MIPPVNISNLIGAVLRNEIAFPDMDPARLALLFVLMTVLTVALIALVKEKPPQ